MKLEDLMPPLELCKQIPAGEFADSALAWMVLPDGSLHPVFPIIARNATLPDDDLIPAPTLEEILREMAKYPHRFNNLTCDAYEEMDFGVTAFVPYRGKPGSTLTEYRDGSGATAALKLWLEVSK